MLFYSLYFAFFVLYFFIYDERQASLMREFKGVEYGDKSKNKEKRKGKIEATLQKEGNAYNSDKCTRYAITRHKIEGRSINLRLIELDDAEFIVSLRGDSKKAQYLSSIDCASQRRWISEYKHREQEGREFYFVIESKSLEPFGLVRMYDFRGDSFCWGSWIIREGAPKVCAIESALCIYEFAFFTLAFTKAHFDVRKDNQRVVAFHKRFGAKVVGEDEINYYFNFSCDDFKQAKKRYAKYL